MAHSPALRLTLTPAEMKRLVLTIRDWQRLDSDAALGVGDVIDDSLLRKVDAAIRRYGQPLPHDPAFIEHAAQRHPKGLKRRARESSALAQEHKAKTD